MPEFLFPVPKDVLEKLIHRANEARDQGEKYSQVEARVSVLLDIDRHDEPKPKADYARIWGWHKSTVSRNWDAILEDVHDWRTFYREKRERNTDATPAQRPRNSESTTDPENSGVSEDERNGDATAMQRPRNGRATHTNTDKQNTDNLYVPSEQTLARAEEAPCSPEEVCRKFMAEGLDFEVAETLTDKFFAYYDERDWRYKDSRGNVNDIERGGPDGWPLRVRSWVNRWQREQEAGTAGEERGEGDGSGGSGKPKRKGTSEKYAHLDELVEGGSK